MTIQPIVEGHGEVQALPTLLRRLLYGEAGLFTVNVAAPFRRKRSELVDESKFKNGLRSILKRPTCNGLLILFDADDSCAKTTSETIRQWLNDECPNVPSEIVIAVREYEAWFLAGVEGLRGVRGVKQDAQPHPMPESPRDAKGALESLMESGMRYAETLDQAALSDSFDLAAAYRRSRSFRHFITAFGRLLATMNCPIQTWPPLSWPTADFPETS